jgi:predicted amidophosphoribosyltransferase
MEREAKAEIDEILTIYQKDHGERCSKCGQESEDIEDRYSFGVYAGRLCAECCLKYLDHCGIDGEQGQPEELVSHG